MVTEFLRSLGQLPSREALPSIRNMHIVQAFLRNVHSIKPWATALEAFRVSVSVDVVVIVQLRLWKSRDSLISGSQWCYHLLIVIRDIKYALLYLFIRSIINYFGSILRIRCCQPKCIIFIFVGWFDYHGRVFFFLIYFDVRRVVHNWNLLLLPISRIIKNQTQARSFSLPGLRFNQILLLSRVLIQVFVHASSTSLLYFSVWPPSVRRLYS